eukprot:CAMPEP_0203966088 /NCGR_PEP_ID=MMETSP0359-20131031/95428_1 /ASSEMBLY_ACC=CAM_ASM_000338 /TAXON_ID=268821 /ORGANISM="Scrippsiella Hangoei, Strain SHTV-5" /LENGTH=34 /DNA_ID= /DNA_START= /DNA_END= /DNA_ORIENTATION=
MNDPSIRDTRRLFEFMSKDLLSQGAWLNETSQGK